MKMLMMTMIMVMMMMTFIIIIIMLIIIIKVVTFRTEFGLFGIMTCFDALFKHPFIDLVEDKGWKISTNTIVIIARPSSL